MDLVKLSAHLSEIGIIKKKQADEIESALKGTGLRSPDFIKTLDNSGKGIERIYDELVANGYSPKSKYGKSAKGALKKSIGACAAYAKQNASKTPDSVTNRALTEKLEKIAKAIPEASAPGVNFKAEVIGAIAAVNEALEAQKEFAPTDAARVRLEEAQRSLAKIEQSLGGVLDVATAKAASNAKAILDKIGAAASDFVNHNYNSENAAKALTEAVSLAEGWCGAKLATFGGEAKAELVDTGAATPGKVKTMVRYRGAKANVYDAGELLKSKMSSSEKNQSGKIKEQKAKRDAEREKIRTLEDEKEAVIADYKAGVLDSTEAKEKILDIQKDIVKSEERVENYTRIIDQYSSVADANEGKLEELYNIIDNISFFADNPEVIVSIADVIDFEAISAFINGSSNDIVIDRVVKIDTVANIISNTIRESAEEIKEKLSKARSFTKHTSKNEVSLEEKVKQSEKQKQDADSFMEDLIAGSSGNKKKVEIPTGGGNKVDDTLIAISDDI